MKPPTTLIVSQQQLLIIREIIERQEMLLHSLRKSEDHRVIGERILMGLQAIVTMLELQHTVIVDDAVSSETKH